MSAKTDQGDEPSAPDAAAAGPALPWQTAKESSDDATAPDRVRATMMNSSYRIAEADPEFISSDTARGTRLQLDYMKAEAGLAAHGIGHAIVVFGSTRIPEPKAARRALEVCIHAQEQDPDNRQCQRNVDVARQILEKSRYYDVAHDFACKVAKASNDAHGERVAIITGGGPGLMEAANRGALAAGGKSVGLNISLPHEQYPNPYLTAGLCFQFHYFAIRKLHFLHRARALIAFPGGFGTMDELFETLVLIQTRKIPCLPVILVGRSFWSQAIDFDFLVQEGVIAETDTDLFRYAETADDIFSSIVSWHDQQGINIFGQGAGPAPSESKT